MSIINFLTVDSSAVTVTKDEKEFGSLKFEGFFKQNITAISRDNRIYDFVRSGFGNLKYEFRQSNEVFVAAKMLPWGRMSIENIKTGSRYMLKLKSFFRNKYDLMDENSDLLFHIKIKRGFFVTIKEAVIETAEKFDNIKEQFLICGAAFLIIKKRIRRK